MLAVKSKKECSKQAFSVIKNLWPCYSAEIKLAALYASIDYSACLLCTPFWSQSTARICSTSWARICIKSHTGPYLRQTDSYHGSAHGMRNELHLSGKVALERLSWHASSVMKRHFHEMTSKHNGIEGGCGRQTEALYPHDRLREEMTLHRKSFLVGQFLPC